MGEEGDSGGRGAFLPPEPGGRAPDLGARPAAGPPAPSHRGFAPPAEHDAHAPQPQAYPPAAQQLGWGAAPPAGQPGQQQPWAPSPRPIVPDNGAAVAGLSLSITAAALLLLSLGTSTIVSIVCAALGIRYSRQGRDRVDRGETPKHRGLAQAGFVTGIVALGLSILATVLWLMVVVLYATDEGFRDDLKDELDGGTDDSPGGFQTSLALAVVTVRSVASLLR